MRKKNKSKVIQSEKSEETVQTQTGNENKHNKGLDCTNSFTKQESMVIRKEKIPSVPRSTPIAEYLLSYPS